jgi:hypothetical protein
MKENKEPYYYPTEGVLGGNCTQRCMIKDNGVMIGSTQCQECEFCTDMAEQFDEYSGPEWIVCSRIDEAIHGVYPDFLTEKQEGMSTGELLQSLMAFFVSISFFIFGAYVTIYILSLPFIMVGGLIIVEQVIRLLIVLYVNKRIFRKYDKMLNKFK